MPQRQALCLQHVPFEGPGSFEGLLQERGWAMDRRLVPVDGLPSRLPSVLFVMGGPMSVNDPDAWIAEEIEFIRAAVHARVPMVGVCLGSQLLARALGAKVRPGPALEVGINPVTLTPDANGDPVFQAFPRTMDVFQWHGEILDLPTDAVVLARSAVAPVQAFRYGTAAYGTLFHLEMQADGIRHLCKQCAADLDRAQLDAAMVSRQASGHLATFRGWAARLVDRLLEAVPPS